MTNFIFYRTFITNLLSSPQVCLQFYFQNPPIGKEDIFNQIMYFSLIKHQRCGSLHNLFNVQISNQLYEIVFKLNVLIIEETDIYQTVHLIKYIT